MDIPALSLQSGQEGFFAAWNAGPAPRLLSEVLTAQQASWPAGLVHPRCDRMCRSDLWAGGRPPSATSGSCSGSGLKSDQSTFPDFSESLLPPWEMRRLV